MKVAHVFIRMPVGGAEDLVGDILRASPKNIETKVVCLCELGRVGEGLRERHPESVELLPCVRGKRFRTAAVAELAHWLTHNEIQLVHTHVYNAHVYGVLSARKAGIPVVMHHHKTHAQMRMRRKWVLRWLSRRAAAHITLSEQTRKDFSSAFHIPLSRIRCFVNPVDEDTFQPCRDLARLRSSLGLEPQQPLIGTVASLSPQKNHGLNVEMVTHLNGMGFNGRFLTFGEGGERSNLESAVEQAALTNFDLMGARRPISPWMQALDIFVLASTWEGQPMALLQALASGLPIAATRIEGNEAVLGSDHPALFDLDDPRAYAQTVWRLLSQPTFRQKVLRHQAVRRETLPTLQHYVNDLSSFYEGLASPAD